MFYQIYEIMYITNQFIIDYEELKNLRHVNKFCYYYPYKMIYTAKSINTKNKHLKYLPYLTMLDCSGNNRLSNYVFKYVPNLEIILCERNTHFTNKYIKKLKHLELVHIGCNSRIDECKLPHRISIIDYSHNWNDKNCPIKQFIKTTLNINTDTF